MKKNKIPCQCGVDKRLYTKHHFFIKTITNPNIQLAKMFNLVATLCEGGGTLHCIYISFIAIAHRGTW